MSFVSWKARGLKNNRIQLPCEPLQSSLAAPEGTSQVDRSPVVMTAPAPGRLSNRAKQSTLALHTLHAHL